jgi:hypothetical protein
MEKDRFFQELEEQSPKDFAKSRVKSVSKGFLSSSKWKRYEKEIVKPFRGVKADVEKCGVSVIEDFSLSHLQLIGDFEAVSIIGHWLPSCEKVEMADGLYSVREFVDAIPQNAECMLDLIICNSIILLDEIKKYFRDIIVFGNINTAPYQIALSLYRCVIYELQSDKSLNYLDATALARKKVKLLSKKTCLL